MPKSPTLWQLGREKIQIDMNEITPSRREFSFVS